MVPPPPMFRPPFLRFALPAIALLAPLVFPGCRSEAKRDGRTQVVYWEKWTGAEEASMQAAVDQFNGAQDKVTVELLAVSGIERKTLLATAGGDPPDIAGLWIQQIASWADRGALSSLDEFIREEGQTPDEFLSRYEKVYADMCRYQGKVVALPATPATMALHWNKNLFREAGLDPERPPRTIGELMEFSKKLTKRDPQTGALRQVGFLPQDPGWWPWAFPRWFGGELVGPEGEILFGKLPPNRDAMHWVRSYTDLYGPDNLKIFASGFGQFGSAQYPFFSGKVAMVFQGVWFNNYIRQYAPGLDYGVAPWPAVHPGDAPYTIAEADMLVVPRGAKNARAAWQFLKHLTTVNRNARSREELQGVELVCYLQEKSSPLREWSPYFTERHPHPYIGIFRELARSPRADFTPRIGIWQEYSREVNIAFDKIRLAQTTTDEAIDYAQARIEASWARQRTSLERQRRADAAKP